MIRFDGITIDRKRQRVECDGRVLQFDQTNRRRPQVLFRLACILLLAGPKNKPQLCELLYGHEAGGGPLSWVRVVDVLVHRLKRRFGTIGIELRSVSGPGGRLYYAEPAMICDQYREAAE